MVYKAIVCFLLVINILYSYRFLIISTILAMLAGGQIWFTRYIRVLKVWEFFKKLFPTTFLWIMILLIHIFVLYLLFCSVSLYINSWYPLYLFNQHLKISFWVCSFFLTRLVIFRPFARYLLTFFLLVPIDLNVVETISLLYEYCMLNLLAMRSS